MAIQHEAKEVYAYLEWFKYQYPDILVYKIQNEGKRNPWMSKKLGIVAGMPDLQIIRAVGHYHSLWIEMKRADGKGKLSSNQEMIIAKLKSEDHAVVVCAGWEKAKSETQDYLNGHYYQSYDQDMS